MLYKIIKYLYRFFSSITLAIFLLLFSALIYLTGTIFPQGVSFEEYKKAGGKFLSLAKYAWALDIFNSPLTWMIFILLIVNLIFCTINRLRDTKNYIKIISSLYHFMLAGFIILLFISARLSKEFEISIKEGETKILEMENGDKIEIKLNGFHIDYTEFPEFSKLQKIKDKLKVIFGKESALINKNNLDKRYREFTADIEVKYREDTRRHPLRVNNSLTFSDYSINLFSFEQEVKLMINGTESIITPNEKFALNDSGIYKISEVFLGNIYKIDGSIEKFEPQIFISRLEKGSQWEVITRLLTGDYGIIGDAKVEFLSYTQKAGLGVKFDPAVRYLKFLSFLIMFFIFSVIINKIRGEEQ